MNQIINIYFGLSTFFFFLLISCNQKPSGENLSGNNHVNELQQSINLYTDTAVINKQIIKAIKVWDMDHLKGKTHLLDAANLSISQDYFEGATEAFAILGQKYLDKTSYDSSWLYLNKALMYSKKLNPNNDYSAMIYAQMGASFFNRSKMDIAALYMYKALGQLEPEQTKNYKNTYNVYRTVGVFWTNVGNIINATPYVEKAEKIAAVHKDSGRLANIVCLKGTLYFKRGLIDSTFLCCKLVLENSHSSKSTLADANYGAGTALLMKYKGLPHNKKGLQHSMKYLLEALRLSQELDRQTLVKKVQTNMGIVYGVLGDHTKAEKTFLGILANDSGLDQFVLYNTNANLALSYYKGKKYKLASSQLIKTLNLRDSLYRKDNLEMMGKLEVKYQIAEKDKLLALKQLQITKQQNQIKERNIWLGGAIAAGMLLAALLMSLFRNNKKKEEIARLKSMMRGEEKERARIAHELHDGIISELSAVKMHFSAIEYQVKEHAAASDFREAMAQLEDTTEELRKTSHNLMPEILIQSGIGIAVHSFCEKLRKSTSIHIDFQAYGEIPRLNLEFELTIYRIIQELVQNILKHAQASHILVQLSCEDQLLTVTVEDNGKGIPDQVMSDGMGLNNIKTRVKALDGQINIESSPAGTSIYLEFNISHHY